MAWNNDPAADLRLARRDFDALGVKLPKPVTTAIQAVDTIEARRPVEVANDAVAQAYLAGASDAEIAAVVAREANWQRQTSGHRQAVQIAAGTALAALRDHAGPIVEAMRPAVEKVIGEIHAACRADSLDPGQLLRAGKTAEAELAARLRINVDRLRAFRAARDNYLWPSSVLVAAHGYDKYRTPRRADAAASVPTPDMPLEATTVRAGADLWWPTLDEVTELSGQAAAAEAARAAELAAERAQQGRVGPVMIG